jgi:hypothetical protein
MELDPLTVVAVLGMVSLLIERVFYYKSRYRRNRKPENPTHGERLVALETDMENIKEDIREIKEKLP